MASTLVFISSVIVFLGLNIASQEVASCEFGTDANFALELTNELTSKFKVSMQM